MASFRALIEQLPDAIGVHRGGTFVYANSAAARLLGWERPELLVGTSVLDIVHPDDRADVMARVASLAGDVESVPFADERLLRRDGSVVNVAIAGLRMDFDGEPAIVAIVRDTTEAKRVQAQLALADRMASVGALAAGVAHEINNPLTYVMLRLDAISLLGRRYRGRLAELRARLVTRLGEREASDLLATLVAPLFDDLDVHVRGASEGAERVRRIVGDLRVFARADEETLQPTDVRHALDVAAGMAMHELRHRARLVRDEAPLDPVRGSDGKLVQVFLNLLINAVHSLQGEDPEKNEVRIEARQVGAEVHVTIADTGRGIAPEHLPRLFEPFFTTKPVGSGTGLGLAVCHGIVTALGGSIRAESQLGNGSRFTVVLPAIDDATTAEQRPSIPMLANDPALRILVVDDEAPIGRALRAALVDLGEVTVADSAEEAKQILRRNAFDVVLTDVRMPVASGIELYGWIERELPELAPRVLFMTGGRLTPDEIAFAEAAPARWIEKPFDLRLLRARIQAIVADLDEPPPSAA